LLVNWPYLPHPSPNCPTLSKYPEPQPPSALQRWPWDYSALTMRNNPTHLYYTILFDLRELYFYPCGWWLDSPQRDSIVPHGLSLTPPEPPTTPLPPGAHPPTTVYLRNQSFFRHPYHPNPNPVQFHSPFYFSVSLFTPCPVMWLNDVMWLHHPTFDFG
jgi:hypothetical protein